MAAIQGHVSKYMSMADGTLRIQIDIHQTDTKAALDLLAEVGRPVALAALVESDELEPAEEEQAYLENECDNQAGKLMQALYRTGWFHAPRVLAALGKDAEFLQWCRSQEHCWACGDTGQMVAAHYRKVGQGAGTGRKPPYCAVPLCNDCHTQQHQEGYSAVAPELQWEQWVSECRQGWGHERMRAIFETESMTAIPAKWVIEWALEHELNAHIPQEFLT